MLGPHSRFDRRVLAVFLLGSFIALGAGKAVWPLNLREALPAALPGYAAAPRDPLPEDDENEMGPYTEVSRFFQRIEGPSSTKQFRIAVQDYGIGKDLQPLIRKAVSEAGRAAGVQTREVQVSGAPAFVVTDGSGPKPTTLVTVLISPSRLVLGQGANVTGDEALKLIGQVDFARAAAAAK